MKSARNLSSQCIFLMFGCLRQRSNNIAPDDFDHDLATDCHGADACVAHWLIHVRQWLLHVRQWLKFTCPRYARWPRRAECRSERHSETQRSPSLQSFNRRENQNVASQQLGITPFHCNNDNGGVCRATTDWPMGLRANGCTRRILRCDCDVKWNVAQVLLARCILTRGAPGASRI